MVLELPYPATMSRRPQCSFPAYFFGSTQSFSLTILYLHMYGQPFTTLHSTFHLHKSLSRVAPIPAYQHSVVAHRACLFSRTHLQFTPNVLYLPNIRSLREATCNKYVISPIPVLLSYYIYAASAGVQTKGIMTVDGSENMHCSN